MVENRRARRGPQGGRAPTRRAAAHSQATLRRRRVTAIGLGLVALIALSFGIAKGAGGGDGSSSPSAGAAAASEPVQLPRGGTGLLPDYRLVGFYGAPQDAALGELGIGTPEEAATKLEQQAKKYAGDRPVQPFEELLAAVANADPGTDGKYRTQQPRQIIDKYLAASRDHRQLLVLDVQPGLADFSDEVDRLMPYLKEPDVGLALDPEWHIQPGQVPGQVIGSMDSSEVNKIAARLSRVVERNNLPQKLLIVHRFTEDMVVNSERLKSYPGVATVLNVDGFGDPANKISKYNDLHAPKRSGLFSGFKLFYSEDVGLMSPADVGDLRPKPDLVVYE